MSNRCIPWSHIELDHYDNFKDDSHVIIVTEQEVTYSVYSLNSPGLDSLMHAWIGHYICIYTNMYTYICIMYTPDAHYDVLHVFETTGNPPRCQGDQCNQACF